MSSNWLAVIGILLVFAFGCVSGWLGSSALHYRQTALMLRQGPEGVTALWEKRMTRNLALNEDQQKQVHEFFLENLAQRKELQKEIAPQVAMLNHTTVREIISVLSPDQAALFRKNVTFLRQHYSQGPFSSRPDSEFTPRAARQTPGGSTNGWVSTPASPATGASTNATVGAPPQ